jgi:hypothetical protein
MSQARLKLTIELHPDKGNPVVAQDSVIVRPGDSLLMMTHDLSEVTTARLLDAAEREERGQL